jgi:hypothetical protein
MLQKCGFLQLDDVSDSSLAGCDAACNVAASACCNWLDGCWKCLQLLKLEGSCDALCFPARRWRSWQGGGSSRRAAGWMQLPQIADDMCLHLSQVQFIAVVRAVCLRCTDAAQAVLLAGQAELRCACSVLGCLLGAAGWPKEAF